MSYGHHLVYVTDDKIVFFVKEENLSDNVSEIANKLQRRTLLLRAEQTWGKAN